MEKLVTLGVLMIAHFLLHRGEIHRILDAFVVFWMLFDIHRCLKRPRGFILQEFIQDSSRKVNVGRASGKTSEDLPASFDIVIVIVLRFSRCFLLAIARRATHRRRRNIIVQISVVQRRLHR